MKKSLICTILTILISIAGGYGLRILLDVLAARNGWQVGGEALALMTIPAAVWIGAKLGRDWALAKYSLRRPQRWERARRGRA
jgi:hypothetical protein